MSCWLASAHMILRYYHLHYALPQPMKDLYSANQGVAHWKIGEMAAGFGFGWVPEPEYRAGGFSGWGSLERIERELRERGPLWCSGRFGSGGDGQVGLYDHCIVVVGVSEDGHVLYNDPAKERHPLPMGVAEFDRLLWKENNIGNGDAVLYKKRVLPLKPLPVPPQ